MLVKGKRNKKTGERSVRNSICTSAGGRAKELFVCFLRPFFRHRRVGQRANLYRTRFEPSELSVFLQPPCSSSSVHLMLNTENSHAIPQQDSEHERRTEIVSYSSVSFSFFLCLERHFHSLPVGIVWLPHSVIPHASMYCAKSLDIWCFAGLFTYRPFNNLFYFTRVTYSYILLPNYLISFLNNLLRFVPAGQLGENYVWRSISVCHIFETDVWELETSLLHTSRKSIQFF